MASAALACSGLATNFRNRLHSHRYTPSPTLLHRRGTYPCTSDPEASPSCTSLAPSSPPLLSVKADAVDSRRWSAPGRPALWPVAPPGGQHTAVTQAHASEAMSLGASSLTTPAAMWCTAPGPRGSSRPSIGGKMTWRPSTCTGRRCERRAGGKWVPLKAEKFGLQSLEVNCRASAFAF